MAPTLRFALLIALCAPAAVAQAPAGAAPQAPVAASEPAPAPALALAWPAPARARVRLTEFRGKLEVQSSFDLSVAPRAGGGLVLSSSGWSLERYGSYAPTHPFVAKMAALLAQAGSAFCSFEVDAQGHWLGLLGFEEGVQRALDQASEGAAGETELERLAGRLDNPQLRRAAEERARNLWSAWCGDWVGLSARAGERSDRKVRIRVGDTERVIGGDARGVKSESLEGGRRRLALQRRQSLANGYFTQASRVEIARLMPGLELADVVGIARTDVINASVEAETLRPLEASSSTSWHVALAGQAQEHVQELRLSCRFEWQDRPASQPGR